MVSVQPGQSDGHAFRQWGYLQWGLARQLGWRWDLDQNRHLPEPEWYTPVRVHARNANYFLGPLVHQHGPKFLLHQAGFRGRLWQYQLPFSHLPCWRHSMSWCLQRSHWRSCHPWMRLWHPHDLEYWRVIETGPRKKISRRRWTLRNYHLRSQTVRSGIDSSRSMWLEVIPLRVTRYTSAEHTKRRAHLGVVDLVSTLFGPGEYGFGIFHSLNDRKGIWDIFLSTHSLLLHRNDFDSRIFWDVIRYHPLALFSSSSPFVPSWYITEFTCSRE